MHIPFAEGELLMRSTARITAIGTYVPERVLTNEDLEAMVDTSDEWIVRRTGIRERRMAAEDEHTSDLCIKAVENLAARYDKDLTDVDFIIVCTVTPDYRFPGTACRIQERFGIRSAGAVDLNATCAGFVYGLHMANALIASGMQRKVLVVAGETLTKITDYTDRTTCILFGDGAGAVLVESGAKEQEPGFLGFYVRSNGAGGKHVYCSGLSDRMGDVRLHASGKIVQNGREVYKWAVTAVPEGMRALTANSGWPLDQVDWLIPHSANLRMIESICEKSGFPIERTLYSVERFGNTSSASIPLALDLGLQEGKVRTGDILLLYGFGGGLVEAGALVRWGL